MKKKFPISNFQFPIVLLLLLTTYYLLLTTPLHALSPDEVAVENLNNSLVPPEVSNIQPQPGLLSFIGQLLSFLGFSPERPDILHPRAELQHQSSLPEEVRPKDSNILQEIAGQIPKLLGQPDSVGIYQPNVPKEVQQGLNQTRDFENLYEQANFPPGIDPITGR